MGLDVEERVGPGRWGLVMVRWKGEWGGTGLTGDVFEVAVRSSP